MKAAKLHWCSGMLARQRDGSGAGFSPDHVSKHSHHAAHMGRPPSHAVQRSGGKSPFAGGSRPRVAPQTPHQGCRARGTAQTGAAGKLARSHSNPRAEECPASALSARRGGTARFAGKTAGRRNRRDLADRAFVGQRVSRRIMRGSRGDGSRSFHRTLERRGFPGRLYGDGAWHLFAELRAHRSSCLCVRCGARVAAAVAGGCVCGLSAAPCDEDVHS